MSRRPLVIAYVQMAGEPFTFWGALVGRSPESATWIDVPDPRNRDQQAEAFRRLAQVVNDSVDQSLQQDDEPLQVWVSNTTAAASLRRIGRVMRSWQMGDDVARAGALLDVYAQAASTPGSALCVSATAILSAQRVTGQSAFEDQNLASQLVWWDRCFLAEFDPATTTDQALGMSTFEAARRAEAFPMGTLTSPRFDEGVLGPLVERYNDHNRSGRAVDELESRIATALQAQVGPIWAAIWCAHRETRSVGVAPSADDRWADDSRLFRWQLEWLDNGGHRRYADTPMQAAKLLSSWESNHAAMARDIVIDDDLALVEAVLDGKAVIGRVTRAEERKIGRTRRTFIRINSPKTDVSGTKVWLRSNPKIAGQLELVSEVDDSVELELHVTEGIRQAMPRVGDVVALLSLEPPFPIRPKLPRDAPWTHERRHADDRGVDGGDASDNEAMRRDGISR